jgi:hypothetical protein
MADTATPARHRGRRKQPDPKKADRHIKSIVEAHKKRRKLEADQRKQTRVLAERIEKATNDNVETNKIADALGLSRQMIYKLMRTYGPESQNGTGKHD